MKGKHYPAKKNGNMSREMTIQEAEVRDPLHLYFYIKKNKKVSSTGLLSV